MYLLVIVTTLFPLLFYCFFFFKQKTAYEMRISDWSSDVCSSDLNVMAYLNSMSGSPIPVPPPPAVDTPAEVAAEEADQGALPGKAEDEPVLNEAAAQQPEGNIEGEAAPKTK